MNPVAMLLLADARTHGDLGRVVNAMMTAEELDQAGDDVQVIFDSAGTQWLGELTSPEHKAHGLFKHVRDVVSGGSGHQAITF